MGKEKAGKRPGKSIEHIYKNIEKDKKSRKNNYKIYLRFLPGNGEIGPDSKIYIKILSIVFWQSK